MHMHIGPCLQCPTLKHPLGNFSHLSICASATNVNRSHVDFLCKQNEKNEVTRGKTHIIMKGYSQIEGIDYTNMFAPIACLASVSTILSDATSLDWEIHQFDVKTMFLHGELAEDIYRTT